jgi:hypothetical protein
MIIDEEAILTFKKMADKRILNFLHSSSDSEVDICQKSLNAWMAVHGIKRFHNEWVCVQFLDSNHVMVQVKYVSAGQYTYLLFPKEFVIKSLVLGNIP